MANDPWAQFLQPPAQAPQNPAVMPSSPPPAQSGGQDPWAQFLKNPSTINQDEDRRLTNLPPPNPNMFSNMDEKTAYAVYNSYLNHPNSELTKDGQLLYNGQPVPKPGENSSAVDTATNIGKKMLGGLNPLASWLIDKATGSTQQSMPEYVATGGTVTGTEAGGRVKSSQTADAAGLSSDVGAGATGGLINAAHNAATGVTALASMASPFSVDNLNFKDKGVQDKVQQNSNDIVSKVDQALPSFKSKDTTQDVAANTTEVAAGLLAGNKAGAALKASGWAPEAIQSFTEKAPTVAKYFAGLLSHAATGGAGVALTTSGDGKTLFAGPNATVPIVQDYAPFLKGLQGKSPSEAQNILEKRFNVLLDNIAIAMPISAGADTVKGAFNFAYEGFLKPLLGAGNRTMQENIITQGLIDDLSRTTGASSPKEVAMLKDKMVQLLSDPENRAIILGKQATENAPGALIDGQEGISPINTQLDTATTISRGLAREGADSEEAQALRHGMMAHRKAVVGNEGILTEMASNRPANDLAKLTHETQSAFGGPQAVQNSAETLQAAGQNEAGEARAAMANTEGQIGDLNNKYPQIVASNTLGKAVQDTSGEPLSAATQTKNALTQQIDKNVAQGIKTTNEGVATAWKNIPEGLQVTNPQRLEESLVASQNYFTPAMQKVLKDSVKFSPEGEVLSADYSKLQQIRKPLSDAIDNSIGTPAYGPLKDLRQALFSDSGEAADIAKSGQPGSEKVQEAVDTYKAGQRVKSGYVGDIEDANNNLRFDEPKRADTVAGIIQNGVKSGQPNQIAHFADVLSKPEFGESHDLLPQLMKADIADNFRTSLKSNGGTPDVPALLDKIQQYRQMLNAPQFADQAKQFDDFANQIIKNRNDAKALGTLLDQQTEHYGDVADKIHGQVLKHFFEDNVNQPVSDGMEAFKNLFKDPHNGKQLDYILSKAQESGDPEVMNGVRAAYGKALDDTLFAGAENTAGGQVLKKNADESKLLDVGDRIFDGKYKPIMDAVRGLADPAMENQVARTVGASKASPEGFSYKGAKEAQNKIVSMLVGPLTRFGSRVGAITGTILDKLDPGGAAKQIKDAFFSDPDEALRMLNNLKISGLNDPQVKRQLFQLYVTHGLFNQKDYPQWEQAVKDWNTEQQTKDALNKGKKKEKE